ncbi:MAG: DUF308 domain-containing protein [Bacilli bacterium]|nr:DUF308 domain-containing protein [Bacilli bacterium]
MNLIIKKDKSSIFTSILFLILGILLVINPSEMVKFITYIIGVIFCIFGSIKLFSYYKFKNEVSNMNLTLGITAIIIGIIIMFCGNVIEFAIRIIIGGYILASGINKLIVALNSKNYNNKWIGLLIISILLIICGLYIILKSNIIISTIGIILIIYSSIDIASYLMYPKNKNIIK